MDAVSLATGMLLGLTQPSLESWPKEAPDLIAALASARFHDRQTAHNKLEAMGSSVEHLLQHAACSGDKEVSGRAQRLLSGIKAQKLKALDRDLPSLYYNWYDPLCNRLVIPPFPIPGSITLQWYVCNGEKGIAATRQMLLDHLDQGIPIWYTQATLRHLRMLRDTHQAVFPGAPIDPQETP